MLVVAMWFTSCLDFTGNKKDPACARPGGLIKSKPPFWLY
jgi:hypothetical protein